MGVLVHYDLVEEVIDSQNEDVVLLLLSVNLHLRVEDDLDGELLHYGCWNMGVDHQRNKY